MSQEKKKRMMTRHLMTASALLGVIPEDLIETEVQIQQEKLKALAEKMTPKRPPPINAAAPARNGGQNAVAAGGRGQGRVARGGGVSGRSAAPTRVPGR